MKGRFLLNVVIRKGPAVLELLPSENEALLIGRDPLLVLDLSLDIVNGVRRLHFQRDGLSSECLHEDLHSTTKAKDEVERRLFLDVVIGESPAILELFSGKDKSLLIGRDAFFVLDLRFDVVDRVRRFNLEGNRLPSQGLDKDLHASTKAEDEMQRGLLLNVVVRKSAPVLELLAGKDQPLLVRGDTLLVLNLRLHVVDSIGRLDFEGDRLARQRLDEDLHTTSEAQDEVEGAFLLDIIVR